VELMNVFLNSLHRESFNSSLRFFHILEIEFLM